MVMLLVLFLILASFGIACYRYVQNDEPAYFSVWLLMMFALIITVIESNVAINNRFFQHVKNNTIEITEVGRCTIFTSKENGDRLYEICQ